ncbi:sulfite exporter TauE/SafE family protein [Actinomadura sp. HBU206391]|uniref:sulfite exporter TauE/SafE family protein n=1 Tax=Actinomadura sp. HBU206391 TaxID=2731692 RepID=UPI00164F0116|nr:sulfite exporter TauE/SafE family protein [Actinomadura sp. HBU206391]MBC6459574.1 sulfite exporter TauE/SafE family protein [Actinomadura sp. HBU206391]
MNVLDATAVLGAGIAAGGINAVVGSGSLITFPVLIALGYPPVVANVSNNVGLVPGSATGIFGYRKELDGQRGRLLRLGIASVLGSLLGGALLLGALRGAFDFIVPVLIIIALVLVVVQPRLNAWLAARRQKHHPHGGPWLWAGVFGAGVYGGYFGAAQGIVLIALLGIFLDDDLQRTVGTKNVLTGLVNASAAVLFVAVADVNWAVAGLIAAGSAVGGLLGASFGRRLPAPVLRGFIVVIGLVAVVKLLLG